MHVCILESIARQNVTSATRTVKFCGLSPVQLPNNLGAVPKNSLSNSHFFYFQIKIFCHFQGKFAIWPRVQVSNYLDLRSINRVEKRNFQENFPAWTRVQVEIYFKQQGFLELYPCLYPVQLPNYLGAVPGTGRKTLR